MKIKVSKHKLNIHYRGSPWGSRTQQHAYCLRYAHSHHIESHLGKKQPQAKIPIAFLFSQLHFNNVTSHALIYGGHLVMRGAKPGNHLKTKSFAVGEVLVAIRAKQIMYPLIYNLPRYHRHFLSHTSVLLLFCCLLVNRAKKNSEKRKTGAAPACRHLVPSLKSFYFEPI